MNIGTLDITAGRLFAFLLDRPILAEENVEVAVDLRPLSEWLVFGSDALSIIGTVPADISQQELDCAITATSSDEKAVETQNFQFRILDPASDGTFVPAGNMDNAEEGPSKVNKGSKGALIAGAVVAAVAGVAILAALACVFFRRGKQKKPLG